MSSDTAFRCARSPLKSSRGRCPQRRPISSRTSAAARAVSSLFAGEFSQLLAPEGCGSGTATAPSSSYVPADAVGEAAPDAEHGPDRKAADRHDQLRPDQLQLPLAPEGAELPLAGRRRPISATGRRASGIATGHRGAVEGPRRSRLRPTRASGAASCRRDRATGGALLPRRCPAPARTCTPAGRGTRSRRARTRADSRPRHMPGRRERRVAARRVSGTTNAGASSARDEEPAALEQKLAAELLRKVLALEHALVHLPARAVLELTLLPALRRVTLTANGGDDDELAAPPAAPLRGSVVVLPPRGGSRSNW